MRFEHPLLAAPILLPPSAGGTASDLQGHDPQPACQLAGGLLHGERAGDPRRRDIRAGDQRSCPMALAPSATIAVAGAAPGPVTPAPSTCAPEVRPEQRATLLLRVERDRRRPTSRADGHADVPVADIVGRDIPLPAPRRRRRQPARRPHGHAAGLRRDAEGDHHMSDTATWQDGKHRAPGGGDRAGCAHCCSDAPSGNEPLPARTEPDKPEEPGTWFRRRRKPAAPSKQLPPRPVSSPKTADQPPLAAADAALAPKRRCRRPALVMLRERLASRGSSATSCCSASAMELDTVDRRALRARPSGDPERVLSDASRWRFPLFDEPAWEALSPERPLRYWRLVEISQPGGQPLTTSRAARRRADRQLLQGPHLSRRPADAAADAARVARGRRRAAAPRSATRRRPDHRPPEAGRSRASSPPVDSAPRRRTPRASASSPASSAGPHTCTSYRLQSSALPRHARRPRDLRAAVAARGLLLPLALYRRNRRRRRSSASAAALASAARAFPRPRQRRWSSSMRASPGAGSGKAAIRGRRRKAQRGRAEGRLGGGARPKPGDSPARLAGQFSLNSDAIRAIAQPRKRRPLAPGTAAATTGSGTPASRARGRSLEALAQRIAPKADLGRHRAARRRERRCCARSPTRSRSAAAVYEDWGFGRQDEPRPRHQRAVRRRQRHRQDDGRRGHRQRPAARPLPHRPLRGGQQVHRRDREEPAPPLRRGRGRRRDPLLRRGRRAVRQAQRGEGQPRPLRQHRDQLPAAAHGGLSAGSRSWRPT